jgi:hypothetical protein
MAFMSSSDVAGDAMGASIAPPCAPQNDKKKGLFEKIFAAEKRRSKVFTSRLGCHAAALFASK